jgi:hypothetical protein
MSYPSSPRVCCCSTSSGCRFRQEDTNKRGLCRQTFGLKMLTPEEAKAKKSEARKAVRKAARQRRNKEGGQATL